VVASRLSLLHLQSAKGDGLLSVLKQWLLPEGTPNLESWVLPSEKPRLPALRKLIIQEEQGCDELLMLAILTAAPVLKTLKWALGEHVFCGFGKCTKTFRKQLKQFAFAGGHQHLEDFPFNAWESLVMLDVCTMLLALPNLRTLKLGCVCDPAEIRLLAQMLPEVSSIDVHDSGQPVGGRVTRVETAGRDYDCLDFTMDMPQDGSFGAALGLLVSVGLPNCKESRNQHLPHSCCAQALRLNEASLLPQLRQTMASVRRGGHVC